MKNLFAVAVCLSLSSVASAARLDAHPVGSDRVVSAGRLSAELSLNEAGTVAMATLSNCREDVRDWPRQCAESVSYSLTQLAVDPQKRVITHEGEVVARWSRFGRFVRLEAAFRLGHEVFTETDATTAPPREIKRAKLFLERVAAK